MFSEAEMNRFEVACFYPNMQNATLPPSHYIQLDEESVVYESRADLSTTQFQTLAKQQLTPSSAMFKMHANASMFDKIILNGQFVWVTRLCVNSDKNRAAYGPLFSVELGWRLMPTGEQFDQCEHFSKIARACADNLEAVAEALPPQYISWLQARKAAEKAKEQEAEKQDQSQSKDNRIRKSMMSLETQPLTGHLAKRKTTEVQVPPKKRLSTEDSVDEEQEQELEDQQEEEEEEEEEELVKPPKPSVKFNEQVVTKVTMIERRSKPSAPAPKQVSAPKQPVAPKQPTPPKQPAAPATPKRKPLRPPVELVSTPPAYEPPKEAFTQYSAASTTMANILNGSTPKAKQYWSERRPVLTERYATLAEGRASQFYKQTAMPLVYLFLKSIGEQHRLVPVMKDSPHDLCIQSLKDQIDCYKNYQIPLPPASIGAAQLMSLGVPATAMLESSAENPQWTMLDLMATLIRDVVERKPYTIQSLKTKVVSTWLKREVPDHWLNQEYQSLDEARRCPEFLKIGLPLIFHALERAKEVYHVVMVPELEASAMPVNTELKLNEISRLKTELNRAREQMRQQKLHPPVVVDKSVSSYDAETQRLLYE